MKLSRSPRDLWASLLPLLGTALALLIASRIHALDADGPLPPWLLVVLIAAGAVAAFHRPFLAVSTVGLGTAVLPTALLLSGAVPAAGLAAAAVLVSDLSLRFVRRRAVYSRPDRRSLLRSLESTGRAVLATIGAAGVWAWLHANHGLLLTVSSTALLYLALWMGLEIADSKIRRPDLPPRWRTLLPPLLLDAFGWAVGGAVAAVGGTGNWPLACGLLVGYAVLSLEAGRNRVQYEKTHHRVRDLEKLRRAAKRMVGHSERELVEVIDRIRLECSKVVQASSWFQFEILIPGGELKSWWSGPQGGLQEGVPEPDRYPPAMPGVHRRTPWQILERHLHSDGKPLARIRLWCDPRRLDPQGVDLLDRLIHQASVSVQRCLAGREAREDALTGVAVRRVLERRLHEIHARCLEDGSSMAVVLCDLDHFKKINDTYGHPAGDAALIASANILKKTEGALCCRYGGEEFVLLLDNAGGEAALAVAERVRQQVEALPFEWEGQRVPLTLSAGAACFPDLYIKTAAELILFADEALYEAKRRGRNRVLLDIGQGRYLDPDGNVLTTDEAQVAKEPPRIFA
ncbi:MAG TPA: GGDEF domain-containing protein [Thermoanaerobaculia bacterium]